MTTTPTCTGGFHVDPALPMRFDATANQSRPASHRNWWGIPYIVSHLNDDGTVRGYTVRRLDGGAWDRSCHHGHAATLDDAVTLCRLISHDPMRHCAKCGATTMARYWGPMSLLDGKELKMAEICPVCGDSHLTSAMDDEAEPQKNNILHNKKAVDVLDAAVQQLRRLGAHVIAAPCGLPSGDMLYTINAAMTEDAAIAGYVMAGYGEIQANTNPPQRLQDDVAALKAEWQHYAENPPPDDERIE